MLTKGDLFNVLKKSFNEGKDILGKRKEFQSAVHSHLRSNFGIHEVSEFDLTKFSKNYTDSICKHLNESRNRPSFMLESIKHIKFFSTIIPYGVQHSQKRKFEEEEAASSDAIQPKSKRQKERDSKEVRDGAVDSDSIHLASAQEFGKKGHWDAYHVVKLLAENPEKFGPFLRDACKRIDMEQFPKMNSERALSTVLHKSISG